MLQPQISKCSFKSNSSNNADYINLAAYVWCVYNTSDAAVHNIKYDIVSPRLSNMSSVKCEDFLFRGQNGQSGCHKVDGNNWRITELSWLHCLFCAAVAWTLNVRATIQKRFPVSLYLSPNCLYSERYCDIGWYCLDLKLTRHLWNVISFCSHLP